MDVSGLVFTCLGICFEVASTLYSYGKQVKGARRNIQSLSNELFGLIGALEHLKLQQKQQADQEAQSSQPPPYMEIDDQPSAVDFKAPGSAKDAHKENIASVLAQTETFLKELQQSLVEPSGRLNAAMHLMRWPLRENEINRHLSRLERVKTFFILSLVTGEVDQSRKTANEIAALRTLIQDTSLRQQAVESRNERRALMDWLCPVDPGVIRSSVEKSRMPGTGVWFTKSEAFQRQSKSVESSCFWLNGITGAGKTTLMTAAINEFMASRESLFDFAYFYCSFSNDESLQTQNILGSILAQICVESEPVYDEVRTKHADTTTRSTSQSARLGVDVLVDLIIRQAQHRKQLYIVIDAINESNDPCSLLQALDKILKSASGVQLLVSSINEKGIERIIDQMGKTFEVTISPNDIREDVGLLVDSALTTHPRLMALPETLKDDISKRLTDGAEGMFRWVQCQIDLLSRLRTPGAVQKALKSLPPTLDKTYEDLLGKIDGDEDRFLTRQILEVLTFTLRPLNLDEVCTMLQITPGMSRLDDSKCLTQPKDILDICGSLLKYNEKTHIVTLAHHSVKMYLTSSPRNNASFFKLDEEEAHRNIALLCLIYLSYEDFYTERKEKNYTLYQEYPFLKYAALSWAQHLRKVEPDESLWTALHAFLFSGDDGRDNFINWVQLLIPYSQMIKTTHPLYYASSYGLTPVVKYLLSMGVDYNARGGRGGAPPINIAAFRGHLDVVDLLFKHGADPLITDEGGRLNAIQWAYYQHRWHVVDYFKEKGYQVDLV